MPFQASDPPDRQPSTVNVSVFEGGGLIDEHRHEDLAWVRDVFEGEGTIRVRRVNYGALVGRVCVNIVVTGW